MQIKLHSPFTGQSGYERLTRGIAIALDRIGVQVQLMGYNDWNDEWCDIDLEDRTRLERMTRQQVAQDAPVIMAQFPRPEYHGFYQQSKLKICFTLFETDRCPNYWKHCFATINLDRIWTFSEFNRSYWIKDRLPANIIDVIPFGIDSEIFSPDGEKVEIQNRKKFMFLTNGDFTERKNFEGLIEAYVTEFTDKDDVCLVVKAHFGGFTREHKDRCLQKLRDIALRFNPSSTPLILFCGDKLADFDMPLLYRAADCYVCSSRGEGLNMPAIESLACGVPVIATNWSAYTDFVNEKNGWLVPCTVGVIDDTEYIKKCLVALNHSWAYPDMKCLKSYMRYAYMNPDICKEKGKQGREDMLKRDWQASALWIVKKIMELQK